MNPGIIANIVSGTCLGIAAAAPAGPARDAILCLSGLSFSCGAASALAVKVLFDRVPGLPASGVLLGRSREIRSAVREAVLQKLLDPDDLRRILATGPSGIDPRRYIRGLGTSGGAATAFVESRWDRIASPEVIDPIVDRQLEKLMESSIGGFLVMVGVENVKPAVSQFVGGLIASLKERVQEFATSMDGEIRLEIDEEKLLADARAHIERLLDARLDRMDAATLKDLVESVLRAHLAWLVVWASVFGALLGLIAFGAGHFVR